MYKELTAETAVNIPLHAADSQSKPPHNASIRPIPAAHAGYGGDEIQKVRDTIWSRTRIVGRTTLILHAALRSTCGRVEEHERRRASRGQRDEEGLLVCLSPGLTWRLACADFNLDFKQRCWSASLILFDSDIRFGLLDRLVVRRYREYESVHPVLRCEAPVLCAHSLDA